MRTRGRTCWGTSLLLVLLDEVPAVQLVALGQQALEGRALDFNVAARLGIQDRGLGSKGAGAGRALLGRAPAHVLLPASSAAQMRAGSGAGCPCTGTGLARGWRSRGDCLVLLPASEPLSPGGRRASEQPVRSMLFETFQSMYENEVGW